MDVVFSTEYPDGGIDGWFLSAIICAAIFTVIMVVRYQMYALFEIDQFKPHR